MFFKAIEPIFKPFRALKNKWVGAQSKVGQMKFDAKRVQSLGQQGAGFAKQGQAFAGQGQAAAQGAQGAMQQMPGMPGAPPGAPGAPGAPGPINPNPPLVTRGFWPFAKKFCSQCEAQMDKLWFQCPHCAQAGAAQAAAAAAAAAKPAPKTMAFMLNAGGGAGPSAQGGQQVIGWLVPLQGPQRGELFTLGSATLIGTDPATCNLVLQDKFMSSKHAEIKVEAGLWMLKDLGSTNGTYVNDKRVDKQELVDNDFVKFGQALCRFKSL